MNMNKQEQAIQYLRSLRSMVGNPNQSYGITNAVYIPPAQSLRNQADRIEYEEKLLKEIDIFLELVEADIK